MTERVNGSMDELVDELSESKNTYKQALKVHYAKVWDEKKSFLATNQARNSSRELFKIVKDFASPNVTQSLFTPTLEWTNQVAKFFFDKIKANQESFDNPTCMSQDDVPDLKGHSREEILLDFPPISLDTSLIIMKALKSGSPSDPYPARIVASVAEVLNPAINQVLNLSLLEGKVPARWKQGKILPLLKKPSADPTVVSNYRPITLLPFFAKALEKYVNVVITDFIEVTNALHPSQLGFRANYSTETALLEVTETIKSTLDRGGKAVLILLDLSAAFDTVPQRRLLQRLSECGIRGTVFRWFSSFLEGRQQSVWSPPFSADIPPLNVGVPQGSVLSPTLFNIYMAPLASLAEQRGAKVITYADDTQLLFMCEKDEPFNDNSIYLCLTKVFDWFRQNRLSCNSAKTEIIFFGHTPDDEWRNWWPQDQPPPFSPVTTVKNLGVMLDSDLSMKSQVQSVAGMCFRLLKMMRNFLSLLPLSHRKTVVQALIMSRLDYANALYLGIPNYLLGRL